MKKIFSNNKYVLMISIVVLVMLSVIKKVYVFEYKYNEMSKRVLEEQKNA